MKKLTTIICLLVLSKSMLFSQTDGWIQKYPAQHPSGRHWFGMTYCGDDKVIVFGGTEIHNNALDDTWIYDLSDENWTIMAPKNGTKPSAREKHKMAYLGDNQAILFGGGADGYGLRDDTWIYNMDENEWTDVEDYYGKVWTAGIDKPAARAEHAMAYIGHNKVILFGDLPFDDTWLYDGNNQTWTNMEIASGEVWQSGISKPNQRKGPDMSYIGDEKVLLFGGYGHAAGSYYGLSDTWIYDLGTNKWTLMGPSNAPGELNDHRMAYIGNDRVLLFGGNLFNSATQNDTWIYDLNENQWAQTFSNANPDARYAFGFSETSFDVPSYPVLFGGFLQKNDTWFYKFDILKQVPIAEAGSYPTINEGDIINFNGSASYDSDGYIESYQWDPGYGTGNLNGEFVDHPYKNDGVYTVTLTVTDNDALHGTDDVNITVNNVSPTVLITLDTPSCYILPGMEIVQSGEFTDPGELDTHTSEWSFGDGNVEFDQVASTQKIYSYNTPGSYTVMLTIEDNDGGSGSAEYELTILSGIEATQAIDEIIQNLSNDAFKNNARQRKNALSQKLSKVGHLITDGNYAEAINKLQHDIRSKMDGFIDGKSKNDWIIDDVAQQALTAKIDLLIDYIQSQSQLSKKVITNDSDELLSQYRFIQNYPNPFNPTTNILYGISLPEHVNISIYNINGEKIKTLINSAQDVGNHSVMWDGKNVYAQKVAGGLYLCVIKTDSYSETLRMLLLK
jgi:PKD repeat protein